MKETQLPAFLDPDIVKDNSLYCTTLFEDDITLIPYSPTLFAGACFPEIGNIDQISRCYKIHTDKMSFVCILTNREDNIHIEFYSKYAHYYLRFLIIHTEKTDKITNDAEIENYINLIINNAKSGSMQKFEEEYFALVEGLAMIPFFYRNQFSPFAENSKFTEARIDFDDGKAKVKFYAEYSAISCNEVIDIANFLHVENTTDAYAPWTGEYDAPPSLGGSGTRICETHIHKPTFLHVFPYPYSAHEKAKSLRKCTNLLSSKPGIIELFKTS